jgi:hypothetical protein
LLLCIFTIYQSSLIKADVTFHFQANKNVGLLRFVESVSGFGNRSRLFREVFEKSSFHNEKYRNLIRDFKTLYQENDGQFKFKHGPESRRNGFDAHKFFHVQNAIGKNLDEIQSRTLGLFPYEIHQKIFNILKEFEPVYETLFWKDLGPETIVKSKDFETFVKQNHVGPFLKDVETFYQAKWPEAIPFEVVFHPLARKTKHSSAEHIGPLLAFETILDEKNLDIMCGILVHEITHGVFASQVDAVQRSLEKAFIEHKSPYRFLAYKYLDEGVATAIGNGIFVRNITGEVPKNLYNDKYISGYGKRLIPIIDEYLKKKKAWDQEFVDAAILAFGEEFPDSYKNIETLANQHVLYIQNPFDTFSIQDLIFMEFKVNSSITATADKFQSKFKENNNRLPLINFFFVKETSSLPSLLHLKTSEAAILKSLPNLGIVTGFDYQNRAFVIAKIKEEKDVEIVIKKLKKHKLITSKFQRIL